MNDFCEIVHVFVRELRQIDLAVAFLLGCAMKLGEKGPRRQIRIKSVLIYITLSFVNFGG